MTKAWPQLASQGDEGQLSDEQLNTLTADDLGDQPGVQGVRAWAFGPPSEP